MNSLSLAILLSALHLTSLCLAADTDATLDKLTRVDPHGRVDEKLSAHEARNSKRCQTCHDIRSATLGIKESAVAICLNCHNQSPHSGVAEHAKHNVGCTSCHTFHRSLALRVSKSSLKFVGLHAKPLADGFIEKPSDGALLRKQCTDCHKW